MHANSSTYQELLLWLFLCPQQLLWQKKYTIYRLYCNKWKYCRYVCLNSDNFISTLKLKHFLCWVGKSKLNNFAVSITLSLLVWWSGWPQANVLLSFLTLMCALIFKRSVVNIPTRFTFKHFNDFYTQNRTKTTSKRNTNS